MKRVNERITCLKVLICKLVTCICAYVPQTGRIAEEKDSFWDQNDKCDRKHSSIGVDC